MTDAADEATAGMANVSLEGVPTVEVIKPANSGMPPGRVRFAFKEVKHIDQKFGKPIADWTVESTQEERAFMKDIPGFQDQEQPIKVPPIKINPDQPADAGYEIGHHWWG